MNRTKIVAAGAAVLFVAVLVVGVILLLRSKGEAGERLHERDGAHNKLQQVYRAKPFPSPENLEVVRQDRVNLTEVRDLLTNSLAARDVVPLDLSPSRFNQELLNTIRRMYAKAPVVKGVRAVTEGFAFGFERYTAPGAPMPREQDVPRLTQQLLIVQRLVDEVYAAQVDSLQRVVRDEFDTADGGGESSRASGRRVRREAASSAGSAGRLRQTQYYAAQGFTLELTARQTTIAELLNRLAAMDLFVVVTDVAMRKVNDGLRAPAAVTPEAEQALAAARETTAEVEAISKRPPSQRLVAGIEIDPPIQVQIELEVYSFKREES